MFYHAGLLGFTGGFVGVDVFFVISGYLIGRIVFSEISAGTFSPVRFYERRIRRILPALFVMMAFSAIAAWFLLFPTALRQFGRTAIATALFASNYFFTSRVDYFADRLVEPPLLHTWTLAVEEQFYIFFPLLLMLTSPGGVKRMRVAVGALGLASFAFSLWASYWAEEIAFYWTAARVWELALGAALASGVTPPSRDRTSAEWMGAAGLALILISALFLHDSPSHLGLKALFPCLGATLIIHSGLASQTVASRILSWKPLVGLGLISYSLYLWHWPILVFFRQWQGTLSTSVSAALVGLSVLIAWASWAFVEQPVRRGTPGRTMLFTAATGTVALFVWLGLAVTERDGFPDRFSADVLAMAEFDNGHDRLARPGCFAHDGWRSFDEIDREACLSFSAEKPNYLLIGDSHAAHLVQGLLTVLPDINLMQAPAVGCAIFYNPKERECGRLMGYVFGSLLPDARLDAIIVAARWKRGDIAKVPAIVERLRPLASQIFIVGPVVEYAWPLPLLLARASLNDDPALVDRERLATERGDLDRRFRSAVEALPATYLSAFEALCPDGRCATTDSAGMPLQSDYGHLSFFGSEFVVRSWVEKNLLP